MLCAWTGRPRGRTASGRTEARTRTPWQALLPSNHLAPHTGAPSSSIPMSPGQGRTPQAQIVCSPNPALLDPTSREPSRMLLPDSHCLAFKKGL